MAGLSAVGFGVAGVHYLWASSPAFWAGAGLACLGASWWLGRKADARLTRLWRPE
jgi:hypothetical protein